ncbi:MAG TPA: TetR/AcrR family transcriptional regulator, partial [Nocardioides sp.]
RETIIDEAPMHRLWYDLRSQSMFEKNLQEAVQQIDKTLEDMIWRVVTRYAELADAEVGISSHLAYAMLDGVFQPALLGYLCDREDALDELDSEVRQAMPLMLAGAR